jgi:uncharacterized protein (UPF0179 family)
VSEAARDVARALYIYTCPAGKTLTTTGYIHTDHALRYLGSGPECRACPLKAKCCPNITSRRQYSFL